MKINALGLHLIETFEGCKLTAYQDVGGIYTIGYGSTRDVKPGMVITQQEADLRLVEDLIPAENAVDKFVKVPLNNNQYAALVAFVFNVGTGNFKTSTLLKKLNAKDYKGAADQFLRWNKVKGQIIKGLTRRREAERELFLTLI